MRQGHTHRIILISVVLGIFAVGFGRIGAVSAGGPAEPAGPVTIHHSDAATTELIEWAVARYTETGLELPDVEFFVHTDDRDACDGHDGYWHPGRNADRIDICEATELLVLHELAHAWEHHSVTDDTRDAFMAVHPGDEWRDEGVGHFAQGIERFAEAVAWGLKSKTIPEKNVTALHERIELFEMVTGVPTPRLATV
jgi:hypothetical protein